MKVTWKLNDKVEIVAEGETQKEVFKQLAENSLWEVFNISQCGCCKGKNIRPVVRKAIDKKKKEHSYYEMHCLNMKCRARFAFGQNVEGGTLFPKRKDENKEWLPNEGWAVFKKEDEQVEE